MKSCSLKFYLLGLLVSVLLNPDIDAQENSTMQDYFRNPVVEEGVHNIILQNRCGNRLTILMHNDSTDLEFVYKPNAFRRKDLSARNFSSRDNFTTLFSSVTLPFIKEDFVKEFGYDPFHTVLKTLAPSLAKNTISFLNIADENVFAVSARSPLLIAIRPKTKFEISDGLITEHFRERGEDIVSFIKFPGFNINRFRQLKDGTVVIQLIENDVILFGGEENDFQVARLTEKFGSMNLQELTSYNDEILESKLSPADFRFNNPDFQKVLDINKRLVYSAFDEGGAVNGALCRIYHLIWIRDGAMSSSLMAMAGFPEFVKIWAPFILENPSWVLKDEESGARSPEYLQILGSRWTKSEDDGIYYALLSLYTHYQTTGDASLIKSANFDRLLGAVDRFFEKTWDSELKMIGSDTRGETTLRSSPYYGYDAVNGEMYIKPLRESDVEHTTIARSHSLYNQVNSYNLLRMLLILLEESDKQELANIDYYKEIAADIEKTLTTSFVDNTGNLYEGFNIMSDGSEKWQRFALGADYWEYSWAVSLGPFFPALKLQIQSAEYTQKTWPGIRSYGYCPWNILAGFLYDYGMSSSKYETMLTQQVQEALMLTKRYTMPGAVTEYQNETEGWRGLPFQIGALYYSMGYHILHSLPMGIAVRASNKVDTVTNYNYRISQFDAVSTNKGDDVGSYKLNGEELFGSLQIPESKIRPGKNKVEIIRSNEYKEVRLRSSDCRLLNISEGEGVISYQLLSNFKTHLVFDNPAKIMDITLTDNNGTSVKFERISLSGNKVMIEFEGDGEFILKINPGTM